MSRRRIARSLALGARFAVAGGRGGWTRAAMTAIGVGLGVALLLAAAAIPTMLGARHDRGTGRAIALSADVAASDHSLLIANVSTEYRSDLVTGFLVQPDGPAAPIPPGLHALPGPGEMVVSPALADLLASGSGALLRPRLPYRVVGTIGDAGLLGPTELMYYAGGTDLASRPEAQRIDHFGDTPDRDPFNPLLVLLAVIGFVVLLVPVAVFVAAAVRFGGAGRDRRLAALRLVGADRAMASWMSAGEALVGAAAGVLVGVALLFGLRQLTRYVEVWGLSVFPTDVAPQPVLAVAVVLAVPVLAVGVTLLALRRVSIEPLGVVRRGRPVRRRLWWRLAFPALGLLVLLPAVREMRASRSDPAVYPVAFGVTLLLVGVTALLPWLVEAVVRRLRGGTVPWQLATRRLQLDSGTAARLVSGIAVAVAGGIGLQMLFTGVEGSFVEQTGQDPRRAQVLVTVSGTPLATDAFAQTPGVLAVWAYTQSWLTVPAPAGTDPAAGGIEGVPLTIGDCAALAQLATLGECRDGDVFLVSDPNDGATPLPAAGAVVRLHRAPDTVAAPDQGATGADPDAQDADGTPWTIPATARATTTIRSAAGNIARGVFATPGALGAVDVGPATSSAYLKVDGDPDTLERIRNTAAAQSPYTQMLALSASRLNRQFANVRRGLFLGVLAVLLLIGASLLVSMLEQLAERQRLLAMLVAVGTRRATLGWSVLWQASIPMLLGLVLAAGTGVGLGAILLVMVHARITVDWANLATILGTAAGVVLLVTTATLPVLYRLMRVSGLRTE